MVVVVLLLLEGDGVGVGGVDGGDKGVDDNEIVEVSLRNKSAVFRKQFSYDKITS